MNWVQFKDSVSHICLAGAVVASWSLTEEVAGLSPFTVMTNIFVTSLQVQQGHSMKFSPLAQYLKTKYIESQKTAITPL